MKPLIERDSFGYVPARYVAAFDLNSDKILLILDTGNQRIFCCITMELSLLWQRGTNRGIIYIFIYMNVINCSAIILCHGDGGASGMGFTEPY